MKKIIYGTREEASRKPIHRTVASVSKAHTYETKNYKSTDSV